MKPFSLLALVALLSTSLNAFAGSQLLDTEKFRNCGNGEIELRKADNGDLAINIKDNDYCTNLRFYDRSSGRTIKTYDIKGSSYTLSKDQRAALSSDCQVGIDLSGRYGADRYYITLGWWCEASHARPSKPASNKSYQLSNNSNCKLMVSGQFSGQLVDDSFCQGARSKNDIISYEVSNKGNCKLMINGNYSNQNVADHFCR
ncbi:MAG: hypothetical protein M9962_15510 [Oligoflexia bacterium]|nr:hypothetical protein [Oligoflexia bacterium]